MPLLYGEGGSRAFRRLQEAIIQKSDDHSLLAWLSLEKDSDDDSSGLPSIGPLAESPDQFRYSAGIVPVPTGMGYPSFSLTTRGLSINLQVDRRDYLKGSDRCVAWLDCAEKGKPNRIAICLLYIPDTDTYVIDKSRIPDSTPAPFDTVRETIVLDSLASYSTIYQSSGPAAFIFRNEGAASQLHGFKPQAVFPDAGWISKVQTIIPLETSPGDWRCDVVYIRALPERSEFAVIAGFMSDDEKPLTWCALRQRNPNINDLEALVREQVPSEHATHQSTITLGEYVVALELGHRKDSRVADSQFDVRLRFEISPDYW